jgi:hypothetical protein
MRKIVLSLVLVLVLTFAACISVHHQSVSSFGPTTALCRAGVVNGHQALLCQSCALCPAGQKCMIPDASGFYVKCPKK